jgi:hypothetical protein
VGVVFDVCIYFCVLFMYSCRIVDCRWLIVSGGVCLVCIAFVAVVVGDRVFNSSRAVTSSIYLAIMASSFSTSSSVCFSTVLSMYVVVCLGI